MKKIIPICLCFFLMAGFSRARDSESVKKAVVKIFTVVKRPDYSQPWQMSGQYPGGGSGCIIKGNKILTSAHVVSDCTFVQVKKYDGTKKYTAYISEVDHACDLAVLKVHDESFFDGSEPLKIGELTGLGDKVTVYGFPIGGEKLSITEGVVSRIEIGQYSHSGRSLLQVQIDAAINRGNSGGPVIRNGELVGVAFETMSKAQSIGYTIPPVIIRHFLKDAEQDDYGGFPMLGIYCQKLENETHRKYLGMKESQSGVVVTKVVYNSSARGKLKPGDVVLAAGGKNIANDRTVRFKNNERIDMAYIITTAYTGDKMNVKVLRDGKEKNIPLTMKSPRKLVEKREYDSKPAYYIFGGYVFVKLLGEHLNINGIAGTGGLMVFGNYYFNGIPTEKKQEVVMLQYVLADEFNLGYHDYKGKIVAAVNGERVKGIRDFMEKTENAKGKYLIIEFEDKKKIIMDLKEARKVSPEILDKYKIPSDRPAYLNEI